MHNNNRTQNKLHISRSYRYIAACSCTLFPFSNFEVNVLVCLSIVFMKYKYSSDFTFTCFFPSFFSVLLLHRPSSVFQLVYTHLHLLFYSRFERKRKENHNFFLLLFVTISLSDERGAPSPIFIMWRCLTARTTSTAAYSVSTSHRNTIKLLPRHRREMTNIKTE